MAVEAEEEALEEEEAALEEAPPEEAQRGSPRSRDSFLKAVVAGATVGRAAAGTRISSI